jgi:hypothetical protein
MSRKIQFLIFLGLCFISAALLSRGAQWLDTRRHPLVSSLTCIETDDIADLYWRINQIEVSAGISSDDRTAVLKLRNNVPNFDSYLFRLDGNEQWHKSSDGRIGLEAGEGVHQIELKAITSMGGETPSILRTVKISDGAVIIMPDENKMERSRYDFRFEHPGSDKIAWLREHTLPVIAGCPTQWNAFLALRSWVSKQIPNKYPTMKSRWDAQRILNAVWDDPSLGFICDAYAATYVSACVSTGLNARMIHLGDENHNGHYAAEVWSDQQDKWIFMDPLYDLHFSLGRVPLSAIELHQLWKQGTMEEITAQGRGGTVVKIGAPSRDYANLFQDIQLINANDFLTTPFNSVIDLLTMKIRFLRYVDESNPPYNRLKLAGQIMTFYYLPIFITGVIIPFVIPACIIFMIMRLGRKRERSDGNSL